MVKFTIHAGHAPSGGQGCGVNGYINESDEARKVVKHLMYMFSKHDGMDVIDCTVNENMSAQKVLNKLNERMNAFNGMFNLSIHLNGGQGTGPECWCYHANSDSVPLAKMICSRISDVFNLYNRGVKYNDKLSVIRNTKAPTIIVECIFVDRAEDAGVWNPVKCAEAIAAAIIDFFDIMDTEIDNVTDGGEDNRDVLYKVQMGAFRDKDNAKRLAIELERNGYSTYIKEESKK